MTASLLPPASTAAERALEQAVARIGDVSVPMRDLWDPATCPAELLPWLAWGLSIDVWNGEWSVAEKRAAVAGCIEAQRHKGTLASIRTVIDRFDPMIDVVEWFDARDTLNLHTFRVELPIAAESDVIYDDELVTALIRDITAVKPLRSHMEMVVRLVAQAHAWLLGNARIAGARRLDMAASESTAADPFWARILTTEDGEPILSETGDYLEVT